jgi:hydrogenase maturation factor HypE
MLIMGLILQTMGGGGGSNSTGYVGGGTQYMITNTLEIFASAAIQTLLKLNLIRSERIGDLDAMEIQCSPKEVKLCFTRKRG